MNQSMSEGLKPCPFCGNADRLFCSQGGEFWYISCTNPSCTYITFGGFPTDSEAIAAWNNRDDRYKRMWERLREWCNDENEMATDSEMKVLELEQEIK